MNDEHVRELPKDRGAESQVLACCFIDPQLIEELGDIVTHADFSAVPYATIWDGMQAVYRKHNDFDVALLLSWLQEAKLFERAGGWATIREVTDLVGTTQNAVHYARRVRDYARRRSIIIAAQTIASDGYTETIEDVEGWAVDCEKALAEASAGYVKDSDRSAAQAMDAFERRVMNPDEICEGPALVTQFGTLNDDFGVGGVQRKMTLVVGRPGMGKTAFSLNLASYWLLTGLRGAIFSMEMQEHELAGRFVAMNSGLHYRDLVDPDKGFDGDDYQRFAVAGDKIRQWSLIYDFQTGLTASQISSRSRRIRRRLGGLDFIIVDHFHQMNHGTGDKYAREDVQMKRSSGILRDLAKDLDCAVIVLAQLSRKCEERPDRKPTKADIRECGALEEDAQTILSPFWPWYYRKSTPAFRTANRTDAELLILKNRDGAEGELQLRYNPEAVRYTEDS